MSDLFEPLRELGRMFPDEKRHPIVSESEDWDELIIPALVSWSEALQQVSKGARPDTIYMLIPMLRVLTEIIYMLGYERGKHEQQKGDDDLSAFKF